MQGVFASEANAKEDVNLGEKKLTASIESCYTLFCYFLSLFPELKRYRLNKIEDLKGKLFPTYEDLNPNTKFVDNLVIAQIEDNVTLNQLWNQLSVRWDDQGDFIVQIFQEVAKSEDFQYYMNNPERSYNDDKKLVLSIIENVFAQSELLHWFLEEKNVHWMGRTFDHAPMVGALASLSSLQNEILSARAKAVNLLKSKVTVGEFSFNSFSDV